MTPTLFSEPPEGLPGRGFDPFTGEWIGEQAWFDRMRADPAFRAEALLCAERIEAFTKRAATRAKSGPVSRRLGCPLCGGPHPRAEHPA